MITLKSIFFYNGKISGLALALKKAIEMENALSDATDKAYVKYQIFHKQVD